MPKMKSNRGAAKRFRKTGSGFKNRRAYRNHILTKRATKAKRRLRAQAQVKLCHLRAVRKMLILQ